MQLQIILPCEHPHAHSTGVTLDPGVREHMFGQVPGAYKPASARAARVTPLSRVRARVFCQV